MSPQRSPSVISIEDDEIGSPPPLVPVAKSPVKENSQAVCIMVLKIMMFYTQHISKIQNIFPQIRLLPCQSHPLGHDDLSRPEWSKAVWASRTSNFVNPRVVHIFPRHCISLIELFFHEKKGSSSSAPVPFAMPTVKVPPAIPGPTHANAIQTTIRNPKAVVCFTPRNQCRFSVLKSIYDFYFRWKSADSSSVVPARVAIPLQQYSI